MSLSKESKDSIKEKIDQLQFKKSPIVQQIKELTEKKQLLIAERDSIQDSIDKLQNDLNNG